MTFDMRNYGSVFYRSTSDPDLLYIMADMIADLNPNFNHYQPELAVVVTWERVQPDTIFISSVVRHSYRMFSLISFLRKKALKIHVHPKISCFLRELVIMIATT